MLEDSSGPGVCDKVGVQIKYGIPPQRRASFSIVVNTDQCGGLDIFGGAGLTEGQFSQVGVSRARNECFYLAGPFCLGGAHSFAN